MLQSEEIYMIHESAYIEDAKIGEGTNIWHFVHVREGAKIGKNCIIGKGAYIGKNVVIGDGCKVQNFATIYQGVKIGNDVFVGPHVCFTNDLYPRVRGEWKIIETIVEDNASIGANATIMCGIKIGKYAMIGAGSVVTKSIPSHALVFGNPARFKAFVCKCGEKLDIMKENRENIFFKCGKCGQEITLKK